MGETRQTKNYVCKEFCIRENNRQYFRGKSCANAIVPHLIGLLKLGLLGYALAQCG